MKSLVASIRSFLERNKIFFETVVMVALTISGIMVSRSANRIIDRQRQIEEALSRPIINLNINYDDDDLMRGLSIVNDGSAVFDLNIITSPYLELLVFSGENRYHVSLPLRDSLLFPYTYASITGSKVGEIAYIKNIDPTRIDEVFNSYPKGQNEIENGTELIAAVPKYYLYLSYTDVLGEKHVEIYDVELSYPVSFGMLPAYESSYVPVQLLSKGGERYLVAEQLSIGDGSYLSYDFQFAYHDPHAIITNDYDKEFGWFKDCVKRAIDEKQFIIYNRAAG